MYYIRLDDSSDYMNLEAWKQIEAILDKYHIKPLFGIIPCNRDEQLVGAYAHNPMFWDLVKTWMDKGWIPALHGFDHCYCARCGGINPVNNRSEFAGVPLEQQKDKIRSGLAILKEHSIYPEIFFAPSHTYDLNTLRALQEESNIRAVSDTMATDVYLKHGFYFIPVQSGQPRKLPFKTVTICLHPNTMTENDFIQLEDFIKTYRNQIANFDQIKMGNRSLSIFDKLLQKVYYFKRKRSFR